MSIFLPKYIYFIIQKNNLNNFKILNLYTKKKYIILYIYNINYYKHSNIIFLNKNKCNNIIINGNFISMYIYIWGMFFIKKIKFKGKGYKIMKNKNFLFLIFNNSHITWYIFYNIITLKINKHKYLFIYKNNFFLKNKLITLCKIRPWNVFTKRGLRLTKQKILKKIGKRTSN